MKKSILFLSLILLFVVEIGRVYFIMPFPGSQKIDSLSLAYWLHNNIMWIRIALLVAIFLTVTHVYTQSRKAGRVFLWSALILYGVVFFFFNFRLQADKMFYQPGVKAFKNSVDNEIAENKLVIGIVVNGEARAYPIQLIGYHHQVQDTINHVPVMVTYCTVCRTGRVYSPKVDGKPEIFRLVGMDHFNAMFEDATTKSWWRQVTGVAIAGKRKGMALTEIPSFQSSLGSWLEKYPSSLVLQPDTTFKEDYSGLSDFDRGTIKSGLEKRDSLSWKPKSWVIGIAKDGRSRAYDWNALAAKWMIQDSLPGLPLLLTLEKDTSTFHVFNRTISSGALRFQLQDSLHLLRDIRTGSLWNSNGLCIDGALKGEQLPAIQAYQEFYHSWKTFHPDTELYKE